MHDDIYVQHLKNLDFTIIYNFITIPNFLNFRFTKSLFSFNCKIEIFKIRAMIEEASFSEFFHDPYPIRSGS